MHFFQVHLTGCSDRAIGLVWRPILTAIYLPGIAMKSSAYDMPPVWTLEAAVVAWVLGRYLPVWDFSGIIPGLLGWLVMAGGVGLVFWSASWFRRKQTTINPKLEPTSLIVEGPYRFSRNPIYLGMAIFLAGWALWIGALSALAVPFVFTRIITRRFILREEEALRAQFGQEAEDFLANTRRW